jgi:hypothetical protein
MCVHLGRGRVVLIKRGKVPFVAKARRAAAVGAAVSPFLAW